MTEELKPCPLCGATPAGPSKEGGSDERNGHNFLARITCMGCGLTLSRESRKGPGGWCNDTGQAMAEVRAAWNQRTAPSGATGDAP